MMVLMPRFGAILAAIILCCDLPKGVSFEVPRSSLIRRRGVTSTVDSLQKTVMDERLVGGTSAWHLPRHITATRAGKQSTPAVVDVDYSTDLKRTALWVAAAAGFAGVLGATRGADSALEFCSGYVLEQCLSIDNLFVFLVLFDYFGVSRDRQDRVLSFGIWGAIILRGLFVAVGAATLQQFSQVLLLFAAVLAVSSYKILFAGDDDDDEDISENAIVKLSRKYLKTTDQFDGDRFFSMVDGVNYATPLFLCLICVELSDVVFAFDSVPAVFGVTQDPLIVYTSNIFAIAGLRSLFGVLSKAISQLEYLEKAVGIVLGVIAAKLAGEAFDIELLNPLQSLVVVLSILGTGVGLSLQANSKNSEEE